MKDYSGNVTPVLKFQGAPALQAHRLLGGKTILESGNAVNTSVL
jgi:hypothetical protein